MAIVMTNGWEKSVLNVLNNQLHIVIPICVLLLRLFIRFFSREDFREILKSIGNWPLDLMVISLGFMLNALMGTNISYEKHFDSKHEADVWAIGTILFIFLVSLVLNKFLRFNQILGGKLYVAYKQFQEMRGNLSSGASITMDISGRIVWVLVYCILMVAVILCALLISVPTLAYVLHLIR